MAMRCSLNLLDRHDRRDFEFVFVGNTHTEPFIWKMNFQKHGSMSFTVNTWCPSKPKIIQEQPKSLILKEVNIDFTAVIGSNQENSLLK